MLVCGVCQAERLEIVTNLEVGAGNDDDERQIQILRCKACKLSGLGFYTESRRGSGESFHHNGYLAPPELIEEVRALIAACPLSRSPHCACASHMKLDQAFDSYRQGTPFDIRWKP